MPRAGVSGLAELAISDAFQFHTFFFNVILTVNKLFSYSLLKPYLVLEGF